MKPSIFILIIFNILGIIETINESELVINFMSKNGRSFFWPQIEDRQKIPSTGILCKLEFPPEPVSSRHFKLQNYEYINDLFDLLMI